jgi:hypothetical protein
MPRRLLTDPLGAITGNQANRMIYKNFDEHITRKYGVVIDGWPLRTFDNPSSIGSQVELKVLLNAWQTGATRFRKMSVKEHMVWVEGRADSEPPGTLPTHPTPALPPSPPSPSSSPLPPTQHNEPDLTLAVNPPLLHTPFIHFEPPATPPVSMNTVPGISKRQRKTRSDKGKPRKRASQIPGADIFSASVL